MRCHAVCCFNCPIGMVGRVSVTADTEAGWESESSLWLSELFTSDCNLKLELQEVSTELQTHSVSSACLVVLSVILVSFSLVCMYIGDRLFSPPVQTRDIIHAYSIARVIIVQAKSERFDRT